MALQILKNEAALANLQETYPRYATVATIPRTGLRKIFDRGAGSVIASSGSKEGRPMYQVTAPKWNGGNGDEWNQLQQCYQKVLNLAAKDRCRALVIPLLAGKEPGFPASIDYKIAVDTIRKSPEAASMDIFLLVSHPEASGASAFRRNLEQFISLHTQSRMPLWSAQPFGISDDRFETLAPQASRHACWDSAEMPAPPCPAPAPEMASRQEKALDRSTGSLPDIRELNNMLNHMDAGFSETLLNLIDKTGKKDSEIYSKANVSRQHFSKIRNNPDYRPTKPTALAFAIALELNMDQTQDLIGRAGYTLTTSSVFDVIIMYFIQQHNYNMFDINEVLYEYDQSLLGA